MALTDNQLLKSVSRSFYLSLRLLPQPMRPAAGLGYLLARTSDTVADAATAPAADRLADLEAFARAIRGEQLFTVWRATVFESVVVPDERLLLEKTTDLMACLECLPAGEARLVRDVVEVIISGQALDLERFGKADGENPARLADDAELEDYTWRVAGCVGAFWTDLGFLTMDGLFSSEPQSQLRDLAVRYGKGLQLVNILRDMADDLAAGRCYLPGIEPRDSETLAHERSRWMDYADEWLGSGFAYAASLSTRRLRAASVLPAMLGRETLRRLRDAGPDALRMRIKVPRSTVYLSILRAFCCGS